MNNLKHKIGSKAANLQRLVELGFDVPGFITISHAEIESLQSNPEFLNQKIKDCFGDRTMQFAVRSSANAEDGHEHSYAGIFESRLLVQRNEIAKTIQELAQNNESKRIQIYQAEKQTKDEIELSFIVQEMVHADYSGVAFGIHPVTAEDVTVINITPGLGDKLVSGEERGLQVCVDNVSKEIRENNSPLTTGQIKRLQHTLKKIERHFGHPLDIEFAFEGDRLFLLQARAITTVAGRNEEKIVWDNSNIIESYPGVTLPLTFSFIRQMYEVVYTQFARLLGTGPKVVEENRAVYANMLGHLNGRVYYNLRSWFKALSMVPGYHLNAEYMIKMMGLKETFVLEESQKLSRTTASILMVKCAVKLIRAFFFIKRTSRRFLKFSNGIIKSYQGKAYHEMSTHQLMRAYKNFEGILSKKWDAPLINDFFAMISFGVLENMIKKGDPDASFTINDLLIGSDDIVSIVPMKECLRIAQVIRQNSAYSTLFQMESSDILKRIYRPEYKSLKHEIDTFLSDFGERCPEELKLETRTYIQAPEKFISLLKSYINAENINFKNKDKETADRNLVKNFKGGFFKKRLLKILIKRTRYLVSNRENLRFQRTRAYGIVRRIFDALGEKLTAEKTLKEGQDIYYLTKEEVFDYIQGTSSEIDLAQVVQRRKKVYANYERQPLPSRITTHGTVNINNLEEESLTINSTDLSGIGCCPGIIKSTVTVVEDPMEMDDLKKTILVAKYTDPGWIKLFPTISAIVVERGSLLSHSAIVARELGIPCIVGVEGATSRLKTGDTIVMNGSSGSIEIIPKKSKAA